MATTAADIVHEELTGDLLKLCHLVESSEIIAAKSPEYINNTEPWSSVKDKHPRLVLRPKTLNSLSQVVKFLSTTTLEYKVRSGGYGSSSATDVLISLSSFDDFESNEDEKYVILGAGGSWRSYYQRMEKVAPSWMGTCYVDPRERRPSINKICLSRRSTNTSPGDWRLNSVRRLLLAFLGTWSDLRSF